MRLSLAGKLLVFAAGVAALFAAWRQMPRRPAAEPAPVAPLTLPDPAPGGDAGAEVRIGYSGAPPPVAPGWDAPHGFAARLKAESRLSPTLVEGSGPRALLKDVADGALKAAVVDLPTVVFAARKAAPPYHVVLLVRWRPEAHAIVVRDGGAWDPAGGILVEPGTSGEYLARAALASGRCSPADVAAGRDALARPSARSGAAAGLRETLPEEARAWPVWKTAEDFGLRVPDVLVVQRQWARRNPEATAGLLRAWIAVQEDLNEDPAPRKTMALQRAPALGLSVLATEEALQPAPLEDQMAFAGLSGDTGLYGRLITQQMRVLEPGPRPLAPGFHVPMDPAPLAAAAPVLLQ